MIYIYQPRFLGDIIFTIAIAQKLSRGNGKISFVVDDCYMSGVSIQHYFPNIDFISIKDFDVSRAKRKAGVYQDGEDTVINLADTSNSFRHMAEKYKIAGFSMDTWRDLKIVRDSLAENKLMRQLGLSPNDKYNLINENYSDKKTKSMSPVIMNNYKNVFLEKIEGFTLFDWIGVIENATTIHTVHTSIQYLIDVVPQTGAELHIYPRVEIYEPHSYYDYLFSKRYIYHDHPNDFKYVINFRARALKRIFLKTLSRVYSGL